MNKMLGQLAQRMYNHVQIHLILVVYHVLYLNLVQDDQIYLLYPFLFLLYLNGNRVCKVLGLVTECMSRMRDFVHSDGHMS